MKRRTLLKGIPLVATAAIPMPAIAQTLPEVKWRLTSSFPKSLDTIFGAADVLAKAVAEATDNRFSIQVFAGGEIVPGLQALDAVSNNTVEMCHTAPYYYVGKDPSFGFGTAVPFGLNSRMQNAWFMYGDGLTLMNEVYGRYGLRGLLGGNTGCQMGGWFRKEVKSTADLQGLKMRIGGFAGRVLAKLGGVPQQIASGDIYPALEKGTIDGAEWVGPYDDLKLGFHKVAPFYYYPGWWEGGTSLQFLVNKQNWDQLPKQYKAIFESAAQLSNVDMQAKYDARNPAALKELVAQGTKLRPFPIEVLDASYKAAQEVYAETSAANPLFKKIHDNMMAFRLSLIHI